MGLDSVEIVVGWEKEFDIVIADSEAGALRTPRQAISLITDILTAAGRMHPAGPWRPENIRSTVRKVVANQCGVKDFGDDDDFIYDIGID